MFKDKGAAASGTCYTGCGLYVQFMPGGNGYNYPGGYALNYIKSGSWDPNYNRLRFKFKCDKSVNGESGGSGNIQLGTYVRNHSATDMWWQGAHYYHHLDPNVYPGQWIYAEINRVPQHQVGMPAQNYSEDPEWSASGVHYFDGLTRFYFDTQNDWSNASCWFDDFTFATVSGEPDTYVASTTGQYSGSRYEVTWDSPRYVAGGQAYNIRYSTTGSLKAGGFSSGIDGGTVRGPDNSAYISTYWNSPAMAQAGNMWVAIQPAGQSAFTEVYIPGTGGTTPTTSPCDVTKDGVVNNADVQAGIDAAIGKAACTADLNGDGACNVIEVQRIVNAAQGGACRTGL